jgi:hypothetical protein
VSMPIQLFFAWRITVLTKTTWIAAIVSFLSIVSLGMPSPHRLFVFTKIYWLAGGIWTSATIIIIKVFAKKPELHSPALVWFLSTCVADVVITISLVISLVCCRQPCTSRLIVHHIIVEAADRFPGHRRCHLQAHSK